MGLGGIGNNVGQGGLSCARWAIKEYRTKFVGLEHPPQELIWAKEVGLARKVLYLPGAHP